VAAERPAKMTKKKRRRRPAVRAKPEAIAARLKGPGERWSEALRAVKALKALKG